MMKCFLITTSIIYSFFCSVHASPKAVLDISKKAPRGETIIWSPLFQATWEKLNAQHKGLPQRSKPHNPVIGMLDTFKWNEAEVMPKGGYITFAGPATKAFFDKTSATMKRKFGVTIEPNKIPFTPNGLASYGILTRELTLKKQFFRSKKSPLVFKDSMVKTHLVEYFGTSKEYSAYYGGNVKVLSYENEGKEFILSIATEKEGERIIVYRPAKKVTIKTAIDKVFTSKNKRLRGNYRSSKHPELRADDTVKIPYIKLRSNTDFTSQLQGLRVYEGDSTPWRVNAAHQLTEFNFHEKGARIKISTYTGGEPFGDAPKPVKIVPRQFICDRSFFVFLWKDKAKLPYLAVWIDSAESLKQFKK